MTKDLQKIFESITPENIQDIPIIKDAMSIFIDTLENLSKESIEIKRIYDNDLVREELHKIYLDDLYNVLKAVESNQYILEAIDKINGYYNPAGMTPDDPNYYFMLKRNAVQNISEYLTEEHFLTFKSYKEKKGTVQAIKYIFQLLNVFSNNSFSEFGFIVEEGDPFNLHIEGTLPEEFYEYIVYPLAHPLGFTYDYTRFLKVDLIDYFPEMSIKYDVNKLSVVCLEETGEFSYDDYINKSTRLTSKEIVSITTTVQRGSRTKAFIFDDGSFLEQITNEVGQTSVTYYDESRNVLKEYLKQCSVEIDYTYIVLTTVQDDRDHEIYKNIVDDFQIELLPICINEEDVDCSFVIGEGDYSYINFKPNPTKDEHITELYINTDKITEYSYLDYTLGVDSDDLIGQNDPEKFIGYGEVTEHVEGEVYRADWKPVIDEDTYEYFSNESHPELVDSVESTDNITREFEKSLSDNNRFLYHDLAIGDFDIDSEVPDNSQFEASIGGIDTDMKDSASIEVYRNDVLLSDNNVSAMQ